MKNALYILLFASLFITSCEKEPIPGFYTNKSSAEIGEVIQFTNTSSDIVDWEWDFGDGNISHTWSPNYNYVAEGNYRVTLTVWGENGEVTSVSRNINITLPPFYSDFYTNVSTAISGEIINFTNTSANAITCEWDFGDGAISNVWNPNHSYSTEGTYIVTLTTWNEFGDASTASLNIKILMPTILDVQVVEYYDGYVVPNASVILYFSYDDWLAENNMYLEGITDQYGWTGFEDIPAVRYYLDVWEKDHNNYLLEQEDIGFIETLPLVPNAINEFVAYVDYIPGGKKKKSAYVIKKLEKRSHENGTGTNKPEDIKRFKKDE